MKNTIHTKHISRHGEFNPVMIVAMLFVKRTSFPTTTCSSLLSWMAFVQALATFVYPHWSSLFIPAVEFVCDSSLNAPLVQAGDVLDKSSAGDCDLFHLCLSPVIFVHPSGGMCYQPLLQCSSPNVFWRENLADAFPMFIWWCLLYCTLEKYMGCYRPCFFFFSQTNIAIKILTFSAYHLLDIQAGKFEGMNSRGQMICRHHSSKTLYR